jgi:aldehyde dehydrogenase (NAD+)
MHSERPGHRMYEQWHPLGLVGIISAFNFPVAVWAWNAFLATICGDICIWKPSPKTPLSAIATMKICNEALKAGGFPGSVLPVQRCRHRTVAEAFVDDKRIPLISFTGSTKVGRMVGERVAQRMGRSLLELGGNNAIILDESADLKLAIPGIVFGAVGTAGQRCTTTRRLFVHESIYDNVRRDAGQGLQAGRRQDRRSDAFHHADGAAQQPGSGAAALGGRKSQGRGGTCARRQARARRSQGQLRAADHRHRPEEFRRSGADRNLRADPLRDAVQDARRGDRAAQRGAAGPVVVDLHQNLREAERFLSAAGSDCGIANVNIGTSGAEIGGAFGGEKETGGGRESGSDAWKAYMRRQTNTINYSDALPLAQGIKFEMAVDLGHASAIHDYVEAAAGALGGIDVLVNNASGYGFADDDEGWIAGFQVDLMAAVRASRFALPYLKASAHPSILHTSSIAAFHPRASGAPYAAIKAALSQYTTSQALALAPQRIRVNAIAPGSIAFPDGLWDRRSHDEPELYRATVLAKIPFGRFGTPESIAHAALFLASPGADWITGQTLCVDGGQGLSG